jgi:hypothetical protein
MAGFITLWTWFGGSGFTYVVRKLSTTVMDLKEWYPPTPNITSNKKNPLLYRQEVHDSNN